MNQAIQEFDQLKRKAFLRKYGFGQARGYLLELNGRIYDSKAIAGAAQGYPMEFGSADSQTEAASRKRRLGLKCIVQKPYAAEWGTLRASRIAPPRFRSCLRSQMEL